MFDSFSCTRKRGGREVPRWSSFLSSSWQQQPVLSVLCTCCLYWSRNSSQAPPTTSSSSAPSCSWEHQGREPVSPEKGRPAWQLSPLSRAMTCSRQEKKQEAVQHVMLSNFHVEELTRLACEEVSLWIWLFLYSRPGLSKICTPTPFMPGFPTPSFLATSALPGWPSGTDTQGHLSDTSRRHKWEPGGMPASLPSQPGSWNAANQFLLSVPTPPCSLPSPFMSAGHLYPEETCCSGVPVQQSALLLGLGASRHFN